MDTNFLNKTNFSSFIGVFMLWMGFVACTPQQQTETPPTQDTTKTATHGTGNNSGTSGAATTPIDTVVTPPVDSPKVVTSTPTTPIKPNESNNTTPTTTNTTSNSKSNNTSPTPPRNTGTKGETTTKIKPTPTEEKIAIVDKPEQEPKPVGDYPAFYKYVRENLQYPEQALKEQVQGAVRLQFVVKTDGSIANIKVMQGIGSGCDEEAVRVLKNSPNWQPAIHQGKAVNTKSMIPIIFKIQQK